MACRASRIDVGRLVSFRNVSVASVVALMIGWQVMTTYGAEDEHQGTSAQEEGHSPAELFEPREYADAEGNVLRYRLLKPKDFDPDRKYPLVLFLHGAGERGDDNVAQLKHGMAEFCEPGRRQAYPCYVLAPQCPTGDKWANLDWRSTEVTQPTEPTLPMKLTLELLDQMIDSAAVDKTRIYITGLSMGGFGTWDAIARRPSFFAAAVPICGGGDLRTAPRIKDLPIWCFHGAQDPVVPVELSRKMIQALRDAGGSPRYTEYPEAAHDSWTQTYADPELYRWLFAHRRASSPGQ
ncbi:MAG: hypothetical protein KatS3mg111_1956 [Pirellulaceae bacterium]|nr:MAG: hypothetical protein KatS3mg111_1956 [Pirellulaceae bacterium]